MLSFMMAYSEIVLCKMILIESHILLIRTCREMNIIWYIVHITQNEKLTD